MTVRKVISTAVSAHAEAANEAAQSSSKAYLLALNRKAEHAVTLIMDAAGDDEALTEKIIARLMIKGEDGKARMPLLGDEIEDRQAFIDHHRLAARAIASASKARSSRARA